MIKRKRQNICCCLLILFLFSMLSPMDATAESGENDEIYTVVWGDTLSDIAGRYGMDYRDLAAYNNIDNAYEIYVGQEIRIPFSSPIALAEEPPAELVEEDPSAPEASSEPVYVQIDIYTVHDLFVLSEQCTLDSWSQGKIVFLHTDLALPEGFTPIPSFGGVFEGNGHSITGLDLMENISPAGLFGTIQPGGEVRNLHVGGIVTPGGENDIAGILAGENNGYIHDCTVFGVVYGGNMIGGLTGINGLSGRIVSCESDVFVQGEQSAGGIAGYNLGVIQACENRGVINQQQMENDLSLQDLDLDFSTDLARLASMDTLISPSDVGGIAGYSSGVLQGCKNHGDVGYPHIGYNIGGIVGRNCGYVDACQNDGNIYGRKDVGGIAGQLEPYILTGLNQDTLALLQGQLDDLSALVNTALNDTDSSVNTVTSRLNSIADYIDNAALSLQLVQTIGSFSSTTVASGEREGEWSRDLDLPEISPGEGDFTGFHGTEGGESSFSGSVTTTSQIELSTSLGGLASAVNGMTGQMRLLNGEVAGSSGTVTDDLKAVSDQIDLISNTLFEAILGVEDATLSDLLSDTSDTGIDALTSGKIRASRNSGSIYGDINVGGICGSMAMEYELDPEDDISGSLPGSARRKYELKCILQSNVNEGPVIAKYDYAGGCCGRMDLGLIIQCENYGAVASEKGDYAGGIAGLCGATIRDCWAKCRLTGQYFVGGICGSGVEDEMVGGGSFVSGCVSFVEIADALQYTGAISGYRAGQFWENRFVSETLAGINGMSYAGQAEPVAFAELESAPERFTRFTLSFLADDALLRSIVFSYGASYDADAYPAIPEKQGYSAVWDRKELQNLRFDTEVHAIYTALSPLLESEVARENGRPVFVVEGQFIEDDVLSADAQEKTNVLATLKEQPISALRDYFSFFSRRRLPDRRIPWQTLEHWHLTVPGDNSIYTIRYLKPENITGDLAVFVQEGSVWRIVNTQSFGAYTCFNVPGSNVELVSVSYISAVWIWGAVALLACSVLACFVFVMKSIRRFFVSLHDRKNKRTAKSDRDKSHRVSAMLLVWAILSVLMIVGAAILVLII